MITVTCITPTSNRPDLLKKCIQQFLQQDYQFKQLLVISDENDYKILGEDIYFLPFNGSIGAKLNYGISYINSDIICRFDDDDFYSPQYISKSVAFLQESKADLVGLSSCYFHDKRFNRSYKYAYDGDQKCVCGATMTFWSKLWDRNKFDETVPYGEDNLFCANVPKISYGNYINDFCAIKHGSNTSPFNFTGRCYERIYNSIINHIITK